KDRYRGGARCSGDTPASSGSLYRVQPETPYTSTTSHSGVKVSFWRSQTAHAGDCLFMLQGIHE
ncbi:hypothetical protein OFM88_27740, partial [Escherichia coli]|nr:hypothetical protein [Escherichia coli]